MSMFSSQETADLCCRDPLNLRRLAIGKAPVIKQKGLKLAQISPISTHRMH